MPINIHINLSWDFTLNFLFCSIFPQISSFMLWFDHWSKNLAIDDGYDAWLCVGVYVVYRQVARGIRVGFVCFDSRRCWWWLGFFFTDTCCWWLRFLHFFSVKTSPKIIIRGDSLHGDVIKMLYAHCFFITSPHKENFHW